MTTRTIKDLHEPMYGYVTIEKNRGYIIYLLGNGEDKMKYVYAPIYFWVGEQDLDEIEMKIIDDIDYEHNIAFKYQLQEDEELDEDIIKTRNLKDLDIFRLKFSPDFVNCMVSYNNTIYPAKVKLIRYKNGKIYAKYHNQEGILELIQNDNSFALVFKSKKSKNDKDELNKYIMDIIKELKKDSDLDKDMILEIVKYFQPIIEKGFIEGNLPFETLVEIWNEIEKE